MHVAIVCGYGLFDPALRTEIEIEGLTEYYSAVFSGIRQRGGIELVILCGGYTNPEQPRLSEARSVQKRIDDDHRFYFYGPNRPLLLEECSRNSVQNIYFALDRLAETRVNVTEITVFSDSLRRWKMDVIAHSAFMEKHIPYEVVSFPRRDIHPNSKRWKQNLQAFKYIFWPGAIAAERNAPPAPPPSS